MAIITFWNDNTGKIGQTHSAIALATYFAIEHNSKTLLVSTRYNDQVTKTAYEDPNIAKSMKLFSNSKGSIELESGIESMAKLVYSNRLTPDMVPNYTKLIYKNRFSVLSAPKAKEDLDYDKVYDACKEILSIAKKYYDIIIVDLNNGLENETTKAILKLSNLIIVNIEQKHSEIEKIMSLKDNMELLKPNSTMFLINNYDRKSKYSTKNVSRELGEKKEILSVPYCNLFADAVQEGEVAEFFLNLRIKKLEGLDERTAFFSQELKRVTDAIVYKLQELQMNI